MGWPQSAWKRVYVMAVMVLCEGGGGVCGHAHLRGMEASMC